MSRRIAWLMIQLALLISLFVSPTVISSAQSRATIRNYNWLCERKVGAQANMIGSKTFEAGEPLPDAWRAFVKITGAQALFTYADGGETTRFSVEILPDGSLLLVQRTIRQAEPMSHMMLIEPRTGSFVHVKHWVAIEANVGYMSVGVCRTVEDKR